MNVLPFTLKIVPSGMMFSATAGGTGPASTGTESCSLVSTYTADDGPATGDAEEVPALVRAEDGPAAGEERAWPADDGPASAETDLLRARV